MIEKKELGRAGEQKRVFRLPFARPAEREVKRLTVLESLVHILAVGPRTRRLNAGNHGASGVGKPRETRSQEVAPRRKVCSLNRQVPGGHTSKVRCRSRCGANCHVLQVEPRTLGSLGLLYQTGLLPASSVSRSLLPRRQSGRKKLPARKPAASRPEVTMQLARFPAQCICLGVMNRQARWPSA